jgi:hypothetical protein
VRRLATLTLCLLPMEAGEALADARDTLDAARAAYYSLRREGLAGFTCKVTPNLDALLFPQRRTDPAAADRTLKAFTALAFSVDAAPGRRARVGHIPPATSNDMEAQALKQIVAGMEETVGGFFDTWSPFVMTSPVPPTADMVEAHDQWSVDYREGAIRVGLVMRKDYTIDVMHLVTASFDTTLQPQFTASPKGLLLTAVQGKYKPLPSGTSGSLQLRIDYQDISGFLLPGRVTVSGNDGRTQVQMDLAFANCQVTKR